jgi:hypothetical protein
MTLCGFAFRRAPLIILALNGISLHIPGDAPAREVHLIIIAWKVKGNHALSSKV